MSEECRHPFLQGLSKYRGVSPTIIVIFGASGDLTARKLLPAIYNLSIDNLLPTDIYFIGFGRKEISDDDFRKLSDESIKSFSRSSMKSEVWERIRNRIFYLSGGYDEIEAFHRLNKKVSALENEAGRELQLLIYLSTPPFVFEPILSHLGKCGLASRHEHSQNSSKIIIEKPFGHDLVSAQRLNRIISQEISESQVFRIDHYLGKETVQDLLVQRFANAIFEPIWNREYVDCVQITVAEALGVGSRGGYYDKSGALRDMVQNHTMQLLSLIAMEPPVSLDPEAIRDEKVKVLKSIQPLGLNKNTSDVIRAQYNAGFVDGEKVISYLQEDGIPQGSNTETYASLRLSINNWRWKGVPFYMRSGKRMARRISEIAIQFKRPPGILFIEDDRFDVASNTMVIRIQPDEGVTLLLNAKIPGLETRTQPVKMHFRYATTFGSNTPEAYERLILDAMIGDSTLFIRGDETEASWKIITPILEFWETCGNEGLDSYVAGSWGPESADLLLAENSHEWRKAGP